MNLRWEQAKEEFGDLAAERVLFEVEGCGEQFVNNSHIDEHLKRVAQCYADGNFSSVKGERVNFRQLPDLFAHDVQVYGDNAYLMNER